MSKKIIKELEKLTEEFTTIHTGHYVYIGIREFWTKAIANGHEVKDLYVSSLGRVYDAKLKQFRVLTRSSDNYLRITYFDEIKQKKTMIGVHRMELESFVGQPPEDMDKPEGDHIDDVPYNNDLSNIRWLSAKDNLARRKGYNMLPDEKIKDIANDILGNILTPREIADKHDTDINQVYKVLHKERRKDILDEYDFSHYDKFSVAEAYRLDDETKAKMEALIREGKANSEIREALNLDNIPPIKDALVYMRRQLNIYPAKPQNQHFTTEQKREVEKYLMEGMMPSAIAKKMGIEYNRRVKNAIAGRKQMLIKEGKLQ